MKVIIPLAGKGTRLRPHTHVTPKPMLKIAGKPVIDYVMEDLQKLGNIEQVIYITGHLKERVEEYARARCPFDSVFVEQKIQDGTAGAVALAREYVDQPVFIIFVDTIFDADLSVVNRVDADGVIWVKEVEDYQRFGVVVADADHHMTKIVEKPKTPVSKRANIGLYYIRNWKLLYEGIDATLRAPKNKGEYYLTDAFQYMIDHGAKIRVEDVHGWYDAGEVGTLLETNRTMLEKGRARRPASLPAGVTIIDPVYIGDNVTLSASTVGPNVSIGSGTTIADATVRNSIVGEGAQITRSTLDNSLVGDAAVVEGLTGAVNVGDHSVVTVSSTPETILPMIAVRAISKLYGDLRAVTDLSFSVGPGEVLGLVGPNGAGKTTTLRCLCGIIAPSTGTVEITGHDIVRDPVEAKRALAFIPDEPHLFEYLTVEEHLRFVARIYGVTDGEPRIPQLLDELELLDKRGVLPGELSRGMRQKLAIACGLIHNPSALILDEPLTGLDPGGIRRMKATIAARAAAGTAVILSSHLLQLVEELCTKLLVLRQGQCVAYGRLDEIVATRPDLAGQSLEEIFLALTGTNESSSAIGQGP